MTNASCFITVKYNINGLMQKRRNSIVNALQMKIPKLLDLRACKHFWNAPQNILNKLGHQACCCPGDLHHQNITKHDISGTCICLASSYQFPDKFRNKTMPLRYWRKLQNENMAHICFLLGFFQVIQHIKG